MKVSLSSGFAALLVALAVAGCGSSASPDSSGLDQDARELLERVPPDWALNYVDLAAVRTQLGLPADADPLSAAEWRSRSPTDFEFAVGPAFPYLLASEPTTVAEEVIDHGAIKAAASNVVVGASGVTVIRTTQPFDQIAERLERRGYERDGDIVELKRAFINADQSVFADAGDGLVAFGWVRETVEKALSGSPAADPEQLEVIGGVRGVVRAAAFGGAVSRCVQGLAAGQSFDPRSAEIVIEVEGEASTERLAAPGWDPKGDLFGDPAVHDGSLTFQLRDTGGNGLSSPFSLLTSDWDVYDCS